MESGNIIPFVPRHTPPRVAADWREHDNLLTQDWSGIPSLPPLLLADGTRTAQQQTQVRPCYDDVHLYVRFDCDDSDIWGTYTVRDEPIYDEEVVEVFIAPGEGTPTYYYEFEVSPNNTLLDVRIYSPNAGAPWARTNMKADFAWDCPGLQWFAQREDAQARWSAALAIPWQSLTVDVSPAQFWRANFYRIERPRAGSPEFSCWSPTFTEPADFHRPARFGLLVLE